jgi:hypothetical protein
MAAQVNCQARALQTYDDTGRFGLTLGRVALMQVVVSVQYCRVSGNSPPNSDKKPAPFRRHSHSIVPGGFDVMS